MDFNEYQNAAMKFRNPELVGNNGIYYEAMKIASEAGEVNGLIGKWLGQGHELNEDEVAKELGDVLWHLTSLAARLGVSLNTVAAMNLDKLQARYPEGFSTERSRNRP